MVTEYRSVVALTILYGKYCTVGYFDPPKQNPLRDASCPPNRGTLSYLNLYALYSRRDQETEVGKESDLSCFSMFHGHIVLVKLLLGCKPNSLEHPHPLPGR